MAAGEETVSPGGPVSIANGLTFTVVSPSDTNDLDKVIIPGAPLRFARTGTTGFSYSVVRAAAGEEPELEANERVTRPGVFFGVRCLKPWQYIQRLRYSGTPAAGTGLAVKADGLGGYLIVAKGAGTSGDVISYGGGYAEVLF
jgi:hypothetical protein